MNLNELEKIDPSLSREVITDEKLLISRLSNIKQVEKNSLVFVRDLKNFNHLTNVSQSILSTCSLVLPKTLLSKIEIPVSGAVFSCENIDESFVGFSKFFYHEKYKGIDKTIDGRESKTAQIHASCKIAPGVFIGENVKIGANTIIHAGSQIMAGSFIGEDVEIFPGVTLYPFTSIGNHCRIHSQTTIGADGFGYIYLQSEHKKIWHFGGVHIHDHVEIGANTSIDGGTFSPTIIGEGTKIDNHVQIGHNCKLGKLVIICGGNQIGGSTTLGDGCVSGGAAAYGDSLTLGPGCQIAGNAGVNCDWPAGSKVAGHPARPLREWLRGLAYVRKESLK